MRKTKTKKRATKSTPDKKRSSAGQPRRSVPAEAVSARDAIAVDREETRAFIPDPATIHHAVPDDLAEYLGESFVESVTTGNDVVTESQDQLIPEEIGGPFVKTDTRAVFAENIDLAIQMDDELQANDGEAADDLEAPAMPGPNGRAGSHRGHDSQSYLPHRGQAGAK